MAVLLIGLTVGKAHILTSVEAGYDPLISLTRVGDLPYPIMRMPAATGPDGNIYIFGGEGECKAYHAEIIRFDPRTNSATVVNKMPTSRIYATAASANGKIYVFGGLKGFQCWQGPLEETRPILEYDPIRNEVKVVSDAAMEALLPASRPWGATATTAGDGRIYIFWYRNVYVFDTVSYSLQRIITNAPGDFYEALAVPDPTGTRIFVFWDYGVYEFDVIQQKFKPQRVADFDRRRVELAGALARNGKIYTFAGNGIPKWQDTAWSEVVEFDPQTYTLRTVAELPYDVGEIFSAGVGPDYKIYAFGGRARISGTKWNTTRDIWRLDIGIDLSADQLTVTTDGVGSHPATLRATVTNHGVSDTAFAVRVRFFDGSCSPTTGKVLGDAIIPKIDPGGTATATLQAPLRTKGVHNLCALVDPDNEIKEGREGNNSATAQATILWEGENLVPAVTASPRSVPAGTPVGISVTIRNAGDYTAGPSTAVVRVGGSEVRRLAVPTLLPGKGVSFQFTLDTGAPPVQPDGINRVEAMADVEEVVWETDENDNLVATNILVYRPATTACVVPGPFWAAPGADASVGCYDQTVGARVVQGTADIEDVGKVAMYDAGERFWRAAFKAPARPGKYGATLSLTAQDDEGFLYQMTVPAELIVAPPGQEPPDGLEVPPAVPGRPENIRLIE